MLLPFSGTQPLAPELLELANELGIDRLGIGECGRLGGIRHRGLLPTGAAGLGFRARSKSRNPFTA